MNRISAWRLNACMGFAVGCAIAGCQTAMTDALPMASSAHQALIQTVQIDPVLFDAKLTADARQHMIATAQERQLRLWKHLASLQSPADVEQLKRREGADLNAKLSLIALDKQLRPDAYEHLQQRYVAPRPFKSAAQAHRGFDPRDVSEAMRLPWESVLLLPYGADVANGSVELALEALARIANPASAPMLVQFAEAAAALPSSQANLIKAHFRLATKALLRIGGAPSAAGLGRLARKVATIPMLADGTFERYVLQIARDLTASQQSAWAVLARQQREPLFDALQRQLQTGGSGGG